MDKPPEVMVKVETWALLSRTKKSTWTCPAGRLETQTCGEASKTTLQVEQGEANRTAPVEVE